MVLCYNSLTNTMMSKKVHSDVKVCFLTASEMYHEKDREIEHCALKGSDPSKAYLIIIVIGYIDWRSDKEINNKIGLTE